MKSYDLLEAIGNVDDACVKKAKEKKKVSKKKWVAIASLAACLALTVICIPTLVHILNPSQAPGGSSDGNFNNSGGDLGGDPYRPGIEYKVDNILRLPGEYNGKILAQNLAFENAEIELYYKSDGSVTNASDWTSLIITDCVFGKDEGPGIEVEGNIGDNGVPKIEKRMLLHCFFDGRTVEDQTVDMVFTKDATETVEIRGVKVLIARNPLKINFEYWYYAVFAYDGVVYDLRTESNQQEYIFEVLNQLIVE